MQPIFQVLKKVHFPGTEKTAQPIFQVPEKIQPIFQVPHKPEHAQAEPQPPIKSLGSQP